jgi:phosphoglycerate dehydrogenase-like enzyme
MTSKSAGDKLNILIASPLEEKQAARIAGVAPDRVNVFYEPKLLPTIRYAADHQGIRPQLNAPDTTRWQDLVAQADIMFDFDWMAPEQLPTTAPRLRWIQATSAGIGEFLQRYQLLQSSITFTTAAGVHAKPLAEFALLGLLYFWRDVPRLLREQAAHRWERYANRDLAGRRVLIIGLGGVGRELARTCAALGLEVWGTKRSADSVAPAGVSILIAHKDILGVLPKMDALILACPLTPATRHMIGAQQLAALPLSAVLVNVGRGGLIDEPALIEALRNGRLAGAALDVFETEPLPDANPLWDMPNVLVSPHSASTVDSENMRIVDIFIENLGRFLSGRKLINEFSREHGY